MSSEPLPIFFDAPPLLYAIQCNFHASTFRQDTAYENLLQILEACYLCRSVSFRRREKNTHAVTERKMRNILSATVQNQLTIDHVSIGIDRMLVTQFDP